MLHKLHAQVQVGIVEYETFFCFGRQIGRYLLPIFVMYLYDTKAIKQLENINPHLKTLQHQIQTIHLYQSHLINLPAPFKNLPRQQKQAVSSPPLTGSCVRPAPLSGCTARGTAPAASGAGSLVSAGRWWWFYGPCGDGPGDIEGFRLGFGQALLAECWRWCWFLNSTPHG